MAAKRTLSEDNSEAFKKVKNADPEGSWVCRFCQNVNWPKRTTCNKEGCHMPKEMEQSNHPEGSWACNCGNVNWPKRTECKKCRVPRAGKLGAPSMSGAQPGSWVCPSCANVNWPARTICNRCAVPKPAAQYPAPMGQQLNQLSQMAGLDLQPYLQSILAQANPYLAAGGQSGMPGMAPSSTDHMFGTAAPPGNHPPGSWPCPMCKNVNWPKRTQCNKPGCGFVRPGFSAQPTDPEGSWTCPVCANVNWPQRTECNRPGCGQPRPTM